MIYKQVTVNIVDNKENKAKTGNFNSAMGDLKGLLDKEGINIKSRKSSIEHQLDPKDRTGHIINDLITDYNDSKRKTQATHVDFENQQQADNNPEHYTDIPTTGHELDNTQPGKKEQETESLPTLTQKVSSFSSSEKDKHEPVDLDTYISDIEDDDLDILDFADSLEELEHTVESITDSEELHKFELSAPKHHKPKQHKKDQYEQRKEKLRQQLSLQIESSIDELKVKLLTAMNSEIDLFFKK
jgi:hypothetical protein